MAPHPFSSARLGREKGRKVSVELGPPKGSPPASPPAPAGTVRPHPRPAVAPRTHTLPSPSHRPAVPTLPRGCDAAELVPEPDPITPPARGRCSGRCWGSGGRGVAPRGRSAPFRSVPLRPGPSRIAPHRTAGTAPGEYLPRGAAGRRGALLLYDHYLSFISSVFLEWGGLASPGHPTPVPPSRRGPLACPLCCLRDGAVGTPLRWGRLGAVFGRGGQARVQACLVATGDQTCPASRAGRRRTALWDTAPWHPYPNASPMGPLCPLSPLPHCLPGGI